MISRRLLTRTIATRLLAGDSEHDVLQQLAAYIVQHRLQKQAAMIVSDIEAELAVHGTVIAKVTSAHPLSTNLRSQIESYVKTHMHASTVTLQEKVDTSILGGVIIETPTKTLDASIATKIKRLKTT